MTICSGQALARFSRPAVLAAGLALSACASNPPLATQSSPQFTTNAVGAAPPSRPAPVIGREWAGPNTYLGPIPTLTVVLKPYDRARNLAACQAFLQVKTLPDVLAENPLARNIMPLRWPVLAAPTAPNDCNAIIDGTDFYAGAALLGAISAATTNSSGEHVDVSGAGPFIVEQFADEQGLHYAILDFSKSTNPSTDFQNLVPALSAAISYQATQLGPKDPTQSPSTASPSASTAPKPSASGPFGFLCDAVDSVIGKVVRAAMGFIPATTVAVSFVDAFDKAACPTQPGTGAASTSTPASAKPSKKKTA